MTGKVVVGVGEQDLVDPLMMANVYALFYRTYLVLKRVANKGVLRRWPCAGRGLGQLKRRIGTVTSCKGAGLGTDSNPAYPRECGCTSAFLEKRSFGAESTNPR